MHVNDLPDLVLANIFNIFCDDSNGLSPSSYLRFQRGRRKLELLSVCRVWRQLAAPIVYRNAFIRCVSGSDSMHNDTISNLDIITHVHNTPHPMNIEILINTCNNPIYSFRRIIEKIRTHGWLLSRVGTIRLNIVSVFQANRLFNELDIISEARSMGYQLFQLIPSIQFIEWRASSNAPVVLEFVKSVVKGYAHQLSGFILPHTILDGMQHISDKLRNISIHGSLEHTASRLPQILTSSMYMLNLEYIGQTFDWEAFVLESGSNVMSFSCLKYLQIRIDKDRHMGDNESSTPEHETRVFNYAVAAPKLEYLVIRVCPFTIMFLASIQAISTIRNVEFELGSLIFSFKGFNLALARNTLAKYARDDNVSNQALYPYTLMNDLFNIPGLALNSKVVVGYGYDVLEIAKVDWKYLSSIEFYYAPRASELEKLTAKHPNLVLYH